MSLTEIFPLPFIFVFDREQVKWRIEMSEHYKYTISVGVEDQPWYSVDCELDSASITAFILDAPNKILNVGPILTKEITEQLEENFLAAFYGNFKSSHDFKSKPSMELNIHVSDNHYLQIDVSFTFLHIAVQAKLEGPGSEDLKRKERVWKSVIKMGLDKNLRDGGSPDDIESIRMKWSVDKTSDVQGDFEEWWCSNTVKAASLAVFGILMANKDAIYDSASKITAPYFGQHSTMPYFTKASTTIEELMLETYKQRSPGQHFFTFNYIPNDETKEQLKAPNVSASVE